MLRVARRVGARALVAGLLAVVVVGASGVPVAASDTVGHVTEFSSGITSGSNPEGITAGPDGNLWFTEFNGNRIGRITPAGTVTEYASGITSGSNPEGITAGPDGNLWFTEINGNRIGRITTSGTVTEFSTGITAGSRPDGIALGSDGNLWFTEADLFNGNRIGRITPTGTVTEFSSGIGAGSEPVGIAAGPDGNLWFTEFNGTQIGRITTSGAVTEFSTGISAGSQPVGIAVGADNNLWFTEQNGNQIGRITTSGTVTEFSTGITADSNPQRITAGADGNLWFTELHEHQVGRINPTTGTVVEFSSGITDTSGPGITAGPDGNVWFTEYYGNRVAKIGASGSTVPFAPTGVSGTAGNTQVTVSWSAPSFDGDSSITGYTVTASPGGHTCTWSPGPLSCTVTGLSNGTWYTFTVAATNSKGTSPPSSPSAPVSPATVPNAPTGVSGTAESTQVLVSWTAPSNDGSSSFTGFTATSSPSGATCTSGPFGSSCAITGLTNGTAYTFTVTATNSKGTSLPSVASAPVTPSTAVPDPPTNVIGTAGNAQVTVSWSAPINTGGSSITAYTVLASHGGQTCSWSSGPLSCTVTGLTNGAPYTFTVTATNSTHTSWPSSASGAVTPVGPSSVVGDALAQVTDFTTGVTRTPQSITAGADGNLWFTESEGLIGRITTTGTVTEFTAAVTQDNCLGSITTGADGNVWYVSGCAGQASNPRIGRVTPSGTVTEVAPAITTSNPGVVTAGPDGNLWFTERTSTSSGSAHRIAKFTTAGTLTEYTITLADCTDYHCQPGDIVAGPDANLWFTVPDWYSAVSHDTSKTAVGRMTTSGAVTLFTPDNDPTFGITGSGTGTDHITVGPDHNLWITEREPFLNYPGVASFTTAGVGTESFFGSGSGMPINDFSAITTGCDGNLWVSEPPLIGTATKIGRISTSMALTEYSTGITGSPVDITAGPDQNLWFTHTNANGVSKIGAGCRAPGAPTSVSGARGNAQVMVAWTAPTGDGSGLPITAYTATSSPGSHTCTWSSGALSCAVTGLTNGTAYTFTVTATNAKGTGPPSVPSSAVVPWGGPPTVPGAPTGTSATPGDQQAMVSWSAPVFDGGDGTLTYHLTASTGGSTCTTQLLSCTLSGLANGTAYTFTVTATNTAGTGPASAPSAPVTPSTVPHPPIGAAGRSGDSRVTVSWTAPSDNGGSAITAYTVTASPGGATCSWSSGTLGCTVTGLTNGTPYTFTVVATNAAGSSSPSVASAAVTPLEPTVFVANAGSGTVTPIDVATDVAGAPITVGTHPDAVAITPDGGTAFVVNRDSNTVTPITVATRTAGSPITVGSSPDGVAITPDGATAFVANSIDNTVTPIAVPTKIPGAPITVGTNPIGMAVTPDGATVLVTNRGAGTVTPIAVATKIPGNPITVGTHPDAVAITPDGATAFVVNDGSNTVTPINVATKTPGPPISVGTTPVRVAITPDGATAFVVNNGANTVTPITVATKTPGTPIHVGSGPFGVAVTADGATAFVANNGANTVMPITLRSAIPSRTGSVTNTPGTAISVGANPQAVAISPGNLPLHRRSPKSLSSTAKPGRPSHVFAVAGNGQLLTTANQQLASRCVVPSDRVARRFHGGGTGLADHRCGLVDSVNPQQTSRTIAYAAIFGLSQKH